jgi:predicted AAA+ superfamily ATPase
MINRIASKTVKDFAKNFKAVAITGPRQSGKTTLAKLHFKNKPYVSLENPDEKYAATKDPRGFLKQFPNGAILDEVQRVPELFSYLQEILDNTNKKGLFVLSGSNNFLLLQSLSQTLAGRAGYVELLPFNFSEVALANKKVKTWEDHIFYGGYPAINFDKVKPEMWFPSYVRTYVERDVRQIKNLSDLDLFQRLLYLCAGRVGQQLNLSGLANEVGVDYKTIQAWLGILQASYIIYLLPPYYKNFNKRILKTPKLYFYDTGLAAYLLGLTKPNLIHKHFAKGALFENFVISELLKNRLNKGQRSNLFYFRDSGGNELDIIIENGHTTQAVEIKSSDTLSQHFFKHLHYFKELSGSKDGMVIYTGDTKHNKIDGFKVLNWQEIAKL